MFLSNPLFLGLYGYSNRIPLEGVQILYPIYTDIKNDKIIFETDDNQLRKVQLNVSDIRVETCNISLKIRQDKFFNFYSFIKTNFGKLVEFESNGISPFISTNSIENVYITKYTSPKRDEEKFYTMQVKLRKA